MALSATGRMTAPAIVIRVRLVAVGFADRPLEVHRDRVAGCLRWGSVAAAARRAYTEGNRPLQCIRWIAPQDAVQAIRAPPKQGVERLAARFWCLLSQKCAPHDPLMEAVASPAVYARLTAWIQRRAALRGQIAARRFTKGTNRMITIRRSISRPSNRDANSP